MTSAPDLTGRAAPWRSADVSRRTVAALCFLAVALVAAFVLLPRTLAATGSGGGAVDRRGLARAFREAFVAYWSSGARDHSPGMAGVVDYWFRYHVTKAVIAALLLATLAVLAVLLWKAFPAASRQAGGLGAGRRVALGSAGVLVTGLAVFSAAMVMANVQGAVAPFASLFPMLPTGASAEGPLADALVEVRRGLADPAPPGGRTPPALGVMIDDFARYHVAMAVAAGIVAVVLLGMSAVAWRRLRGTTAADRPARRVRASFAVLWASSSLIATVVAVANTSTAADPAPALLAFFEGSW
ncbi:MULTISPECIES: hypothetical protein [Streptomyces]|uniref:Tat (Twin-arginine translocation) pathway signal sequence n=1 Tax=Streptomyces viridochromogenes TaxID=1938 RepID=A0A0L8JE57_STRVR|nr:MULTISPECIES: hypothetical protein [Streptomyces]KOG11809.1 hypothetical protein ADK34_33460 [Streptomyces viridochromogenes]